MPIPISAPTSSRDSYICSEAPTEGRYRSRDDIRADMGIGMRKSIYHIIHTNSNKSVEQSKFIDNNNKQILLKISHLSQNITIKIHLFSLGPYKLIVTLPLIRACGSKHILECGNTGARSITVG